MIRAISVIAGLVLLGPWISNAQEVGGAPAQAAHPSSQPPTRTMPQAVRLDGGSRSPASTSSSSQPVCSDGGADFVCESKTGDVVEWSGCNGKVTGQVTDGSPPVDAGSKSDCGNDRMHRALARAINSAFLKCANQAAGGDVESAHIEHDRSIVKRSVRGRKGVPSLHSTGHATDIWAITLQPGNRRIDMKSVNSRDPFGVQKNAQNNAQQSAKNTGPDPKQFVAKFRQCWEQETSGTLCRKGEGTIGPKGTGRATDANHENHIHLECPQ